MDGRAAAERFQGARGHRPPVRAGLGRDRVPATTDGAWVDPIPPSARIGFVQRPGVPAAAGWPTAGVALTVGGGSVRGSRDATTVLATGSAYPGP